MWDPNENPGSCSSALQAITAAKFTDFYGVKDGQVWILEIKDYEQGPTDRPMPNPVEKLSDLESKLFAALAGLGWCNPPDIAPTATLASSRNLLAKDLTAGAAGGSLVNLVWWLEHPALGAIERQALEIGLRRRVGGWFRGQAIVSGGAIGLPDLHVRRVP